MKSKKTQNECTYINQTFGANLLRMSSEMSCLLDKTVYYWSHQSEILIDQSYGCMLRKYFTVQAM